VTGTLAPKLSANETRLLAYGAKVIRRTLDDPSAI
jgi:hypothetical protein